MKEHEFWRSRDEGHVFAVELVDGVVAGTCGPLEAGDVDERFLATFDYSDERGAWLEEHRDEFDLYEVVSRHVVEPVSVDQPLLEERLVSDVMHHGVLTCHSGSSLRDIARTMRSHGIHAVAIWGDEEGDSVGFRGIVSDLDLITAAARGESLASPAAKAARTDIVCVRAGADLLEAARLMADHRTTHLVVLADDRDRPVGVVSTLDLAAALGGTV